MTVAANLLSLGLQVAPRRIAFHLVHLQCHVDSEPGGAISISTASRPVLVS